MSDVLRWYRCEGCGATEQFTDADLLVIKREALRFGVEPTTLRSNPYEISLNEKESSLIQVTTLYDVGAEGFEPPTLCL